MEKPVLKLPIDNFDHTATFVVEVPDRYARHKIGAVKRISAYLYYDKSNGKYYAMKQNAVIQDSYTKEERDEIDRLNKAVPIKTGDEVFIVNGEEYQFYTFQAVGDCSDCGFFLPVPVTPVILQDQTQVKEIDYTKLAELADLAADKLEIIDDEQYRALANQIRDLLA